MSFLTELLFLQFLAQASHPAPLGCFDTNQKLFLRTIKYVGQGKKHNITEVVKSLSLLLQLSNTQKNKGCKVSESKLIIALFFQESIPENFLNALPSSVIDSGDFSFGLGFELRCDRRSDLISASSFIINQFINPEICLSQLTFYWGPHCYLEQ